MVEEKKAKLAVCEWEGDSLTDIEIRSSNAQYSRSAMGPTVSQLTNQDVFIVMNLTKKMRMDLQIIQFT